MTNDDEIEVEVATTEAEGEARKPLPWDGDYEPGPPRPLSEAVEMLEKVRENALKQWTAIPMERYDDLLRGDALPTEEEAFAIIFGLRAYGDEAGFNQLPRHFVEAVEEQIGEPVWY